MAAELQDKYVSIEHCTTKSRICRGYWEVLNGVPLEKVDLKPDQREKIKKYMQASVSGKSSYQISQELGISSFCCSELRKTKMKYSRAYSATHRMSKQYLEQHTIKQNKLSEAEIELINFLKSQKSPVCASVCAKGLNWKVYSTYYVLKKLEKKEKVRREKKNSYTKWTVTE